MCVRFLFNSRTEKYSRGYEKSQRLLKIYFLIIFQSFVKINISICTEIRN